MILTFPGREIREIIEEHYGADRGVIIDDPDFPLSESARITVEIENERESFYVPKDFANRTANVVHRQLCERYNRLSIAILVETNFGEDAEPSTKRALVRIINQQALPGIVSETSFGNRDQIEWTGEVDL